MKKKAIISAVAGVIIVLVGIIVFLLVRGHFPADTKEKTTLKNETGVTVEQASISFANMKLDNDKLHLTDEQKEVLNTLIMIILTFRIMILFKDIPTFTRVRKSALVLM